jgi:hypothetical protein
VPIAVAETFAVLHGIDVRDVPVHRGPVVDAQAAALGAHAFATGGQVFLPDAVGPLVHSETEAVLAHELTHAVQQRLVLAGPADVLERQARRTEQIFRRDRPLKHRPGPEPTQPPNPAEPPASEQVQRLTFTDVLSHAPTPISPFVPPGPAGVTAEPLDVPPTTPPPPDGAVAAPPLPDEMQELLDNRERLVELCQAQPADLNDPLSLDELAGRLFGRLRRLLRADLLIDRERAGLLADAH